MPCEITDQCDLNPGCLHIYVGLETTGHPLALVCSNMNEPKREVTSAAAHRIPDTTSDMIDPIPIVAVPCWCGTWLYAMVPQKPPRS